MAGKSNRPLTDRVFEAWKNAKASESALATRKAKLDKLSSGLDEEGVKNVKSQIEKFNKGETATVAGKIDL